MGTVEKKTINQFYEYAYILNLKYFLITKEDRFSFFNKQSLKLGFINLVF